MASVARTGTVVLLLLVLETGGAFLGYRDDTLWLKRFRFCAYLERAPHENSVADPLIRTGARGEGPWAVVFRVVHTVFPALSVVPLSWDNDFAQNGITSFLERKEKSPPR